METFHVKRADCQRSVKEDIPVFIMDIDPESIWQYWGTDGQTYNAKGRRIAVPLILDAETPPPDNDSKLKWHQIHLADPRGGRWGYFRTNTERISTPDHIERTKPEASLEDGEDEVSAPKTQDQ